MLNKDAWLTKEFLDSRYTYCPNSGTLTSKLTGKVLQDKRGRDNNYYRVSLRVDGKRRSLAAHRVAFVIMTGRIPYTIDHINGNGLDNRWCNLREATDSQQALNRKPRADNTSGYRGVSWEKCSQKYKAYIWVDGKCKNIGRYTCKHGAARAYNRMAIEYHDPKFRQLNRIKED